MEFNVKYTPKTEARRILFTCNQLNREFYLKNGWYVLENTQNYTPEDPIVVLPKLDYSNIIGDFSRINKTDRYKFNFNNPKLIQLLQEKVEQKGIYKPLSKETKAKFEKDYEKKAEKVLKKACKVLDYLKPCDINITVYPTNIGTGSSFSIHDFENSNSHDFEFYLRLDQPDHAFVELLASSITRGPAFDFDWKQREAVSDFFTKHVFGASTHKGTLNKIKEQKPELLKKSIKYLRSIGAPVGKTLDFNKQENKIYLYEKNITKKLSPTEFRLIKCLIKNRNEAVSFDDLAYAMYNSEAEAKFSLWGITKAIQRTRDKLEKQGIPRDTIVNIKGEGFKLVV